MLLISQKTTVPQQVILFLTVSDVNVWTLCFVLYINYPQPFKLLMRTMGELSINGQWNFVQQARSQ